MGNERFDAIVVGAGHNGLAAALLLARAGWKVGVFEEKSVVGGACRTEYPFAKASRLGSSTGAYLLGVMPPELIKKLGLSLKLMRRDPHYFLPTTGERYLLLGSDEEATKQSMLAFFSEDDWRATRAMQTEIGHIRDDVAPAWLDEPLSIEDTAERYLRPALRQTFVDLCRKPVSDYLGRFGFRSELLMAMYATTDGFTGADGGWDSPGTGLNFLVHNMCRLPGSDGTWMVVEGGMGAITAALAGGVRAAGGHVETGVKIEAVRIENGQAKGVALAGGREIEARAVLVNADPFRMRDLVGRDRLPDDYNDKLDGYLRDGRSLKVNLALERLPAFRCLPDDRGQFRTTIHLLPDEGSPIDALRRAYDDARAGRLPQAPTIEWYTHTAVDPTLRDPEGRHSAALFVQWMPYQPAGSTWDAEIGRYTRHLLSICDRYAPGTSDLVVDAFALPPPAIEAHFGITRGHIFHVDNRFGFGERLPYRTPVAGLYSASSGTHPAGSVIGCAGHNAAHAVLRDAGVDAPAA